MNTERTSLFYMANLGSEMTRALSAYERNDQSGVSDSTTRAEDIIIKIEQFPEMQGRTGELEILRNIISGMNNKHLEINKEHLIDYFSPFAARLMN